MPPRSAADILHDLFCRFLHRPGFLSHLRSLKGYDEPEILPYSTRRNCLIGADAGHAWDVVGRKVSKERLLADIYEVGDICDPPCQWSNGPHLGVPYRTGCSR